METLNKANIPEKEPFENNYTLSFRRLTSTIVDVPHR